MAEKVSRTQRVNAWNIFKLVLALVLILFVLSQLRWEDLVALGQRLSLGWAPVSAALFWTIAWANARRSWFLLGKQVPLRRVFGVVIFQTALANFVATLAGAASYVALLRTHSQVRVGQGINSILLARVGDLVTPLPLLLISSALVWNQIEALHLIVLVLALGMSGILVLMLGVLIGRQSALGLLYALLERLGLQENIWVKRALAPFVELAQLDSAQVRRWLWELFFSSALVLALMLLFAFSNFKLFSIEMSLPAIIFVSVIGLLISYIPIQMFGGLGVYEVTTIYIYGLFGLAPNELVAYVVSARLYLYLLNGSLLLYLLFTRDERGAE